MRSDCHIHMVLDGHYWKSAMARHDPKADDIFIRRILQTYRDLGYTYLRDGGDRYGAGKRARELSAEYGLIYRTPLSPLSKKGHYGAFIGETFESLKEYADLVEKMDRNGCDFIKIMISGLMDFDRFGVLTEEGLPAFEIREMIHIAHDHGFAVMAHANGARTIEAAAAAGVDSVEHGAYQDADSLAAMAACGTVWVPTLSTIGNLQGKGRFNERAVRAILDSALSNCEAFAAMGGILASGSDAGAWAVPHGCESEEDWLRQALGDRTAEIMAAGTEQIRCRFCRESN